MAQARTYALGTFAPVLDKYNAIADKMVDDQVPLRPSKRPKAAELIQSYRMTVLVVGRGGARAGGAVVGGGAAYLPLPGGGER